MSGGKPSPWPKREQELRDLHAQGFSDKEMSEKMGIGLGLLVAKRRRLGLSPNDGFSTAGPKWSREEDATLERMALDGDSALKISRALGGKRTPDAVISRSRKLKIRLRGNDPEVRTAKNRRIPQPTAAAQALQDAGVAGRFDKRSRAIAAAVCKAIPDEPANEPTTGRHWLTRRRGECAWPVAGLGANTFSCCAKTIPGKPYCEEHQALMHQPATGMYSNRAMAQAAKADLYPGLRKAA